MRESGMLPGEERIRKYRVKIRQNVSYGVSAGDLQKI